MFTKGHTDGRTDDKRTPDSSLYPRTFRSGDKNTLQNINFKIESMPVNFKNSPG